MRNTVYWGALGLGLGRRLPSFLRHTINPSKAHEIVRTRLQQREKDFLHLVRHAVFADPKNPYFQLLQAAGCQYSDLESLVLKEGVEQALKVLFQQGVYLTSSEFQGREPVVRGNSRFFVTSESLRNPLSKRHVPIRSSGSRSKGTPVVMDLAFLRDCAVDTTVYLDARENLDAPMAMWEAPGGFALFRLLTLSCAKQPPEFWFSQLDIKDKSMDIRYRGSAALLRWTGFLAGAPLPRPEYVSLEDPQPIVRWMERCLQQDLRPHLFTFASSAVRLSRAACDAGVDLQGVQITMSGEPTTNSRLNSVRKSNADGLPAIGSAECGYIGYGCLAPEHPDDIHLLTDLHAVIQPDKQVNSSGLRPESLLISSLRSTAPIVLINVSLGDMALLEHRNCGCPLGNLGFDTHIQFIRSFEKLTSGGVALPDNEVVRILEDVLPHRFGGIPTDYQLLEDESESGNPKLCLVIHPALGPMNEDLVRNEFFDALGSGEQGDRITSKIWRSAEYLIIERSVPRTTATGKIQHMHLRKKV
jgi:hypothetical protein